MIDMVEIEINCRFLQDGTCLVNPMSDIPKDCDDCEMKEPYDDEEDEFEEDEVDFDDDDEDDGDAF